MEDPFNAMIDDAEIWQSGGWGTGVGVGVGWGGP